MGKSITITYEIENPGERGSAVAQSVIDEIKRMQDVAGGAIHEVVINWSQSGNEDSLRPKYEKKILGLQEELQIRAIAVHQYTNDIQSDFPSKESRTPHEVLEDLRGLHDELSDAANDLEGLDDPEDAEDVALSLQQVYVKMEKRLDELEDVLEGLKDE